MFTPLEFFTSVLADGFSLEFKWQQVSSSLQDSSQDSGRSQQCCRLDSLYPSAKFIIIIIIVINSLELFTSALADGFYWSLSDSKSPQVFRTLLSILAVLNNAVVWMVSTRPPTSKSSSPFSNPLVTVPNAPFTIGIIVTCMFHSFFQFPSKVLLFTFFQFYSVVSRDSKVDYFASSLFFNFFFFFCCWLL